MQWQAVAGAARSDHARGGATSVAQDADPQANRAAAPGRPGQDRAGGRRASRPMRGSPAGSGSRPTPRRKWRKRFATKAWTDSRDRKRPGRPRAVPSAAVVAEVKAIACELPATRGGPAQPLEPAPSCARRSSAAALVEEVSISTLWRWLAEDAIKPWQHRSWIFPRDPDFAAKAARVLDLYDRLWDGDWATTSTSSRPTRRPHPGRCPLPPDPGRRAGPGDARRARIRARRRAGLSRRLGRAPGPAVRPLRAHHRHRPFRPPGRPGDDHRALRLGPAGVLGRRQRLHHRGQASVDRLQGAWPNARWSTCRSMPPGSTRSRSTSRSCSARC